MLRAQGLLIDSERPQVQRLGFVQSPLRLVKPREIVQVDGHVWVIGPKRPLVNRDGTGVVLRSLIPQLPGLVQPREVVQVRRNVGVVGAEGGHVDRECPLVQRLSLL